jgi:hypothetical protein
LSKLAAWAAMGSCYFAGSMSTSIRAVPTKPADLVEPGCAMTALRVARSPSRVADAG